MWKRALFAVFFAGVVLSPVVASAQVPGGAGAIPAVAAPGTTGAAPAPLALSASSIILTTLKPVGATRANLAAPSPLSAVSLEPLLAPALPPRYRKPGVALMIVGGAGIVVGSLIDSGLITVAGAGVGLFGLYLYLR